MAYNIDRALNSYMQDYVNLDAKVVVDARNSRDNLLDNIDRLDQVDFFSLHKPFNAFFGSFARRTKCKKLDDIDLMIGISAEGATYSSYDTWSDVRIFIDQTTNKLQRDCSNPPDNTLNSTKVLNRFKDKLSEVYDYSRSEIKRNGEAVTLNLKSKDWNFDIVPCFKTVCENDGRNYYLIPNGRGNWKKTDPRKDQEIVSKINQEQNGRLLELIRLCKRWSKVRQMSSLISSYVLESLIAYYVQNKSGDLEKSLSERFVSTLGYISQNIFGIIPDLKQIQGNINELTYEEKDKIHKCAFYDYFILTTLNESDDSDSIRNNWKRVLGYNFGE